ncbi:hypothetical protein AB0N93_16495 [Streptomyces sp. NPDC091267]|uniref:hypothetical protein n=1 Tax=Streptomyces sp. NPDC091267 TaxID=3155195 RepID=UPI003429C02B
MLVSAGNKRSEEREERLTQATASIPSAILWFLLATLVITVMALGVCLPRRNGSSPSPSSPHSSPPPCASSATSTAPSAASSTSTPPPLPLPNARPTATSQPPHGSRPALRQQGNRRTT